MYCPACGVEISDEGSFCASCGKNIAYLTVDRQSYVGKLKPSSEMIKSELKNEEAPSLGISPMEMASLEQTDLNGDDGLITENAPDDSIEAVESKVEKAVEQEVIPKGFYCNNCGSFLFPEDNYCYDCGNKTQKKYYHKVVVNKKNMKGLMLGFGALILLALVYYIVVVVLLNGVE